ncbi:MAG: YjbF family lipoprotein [Tabrizicola sp.]|nr:YjbF family lipoprotein [Tabrizicola sp.]MDM7931630.1 YjbF family lipoprotein [Tabrizicola sp.]
MALVALAACGSDRPKASPLGQIIGNVAKSTIGKVGSRRAGTAAAAPAPVTRADLEKFNLPILRATIKARGADAFLTVSDTKGNVVTWATTDATTFTLRDGILIQTRGLGPDLMSAQAPSLAALLTDGGTHQRIYFFLGEDDQTTRRTYDCTVSVVGKETIEVFARAHAVTRISEECVRPQGKITNDYWVEGPLIRKSRQLASGGTGFIDFERVVD